MPVPDEYAIRRRAFSLWVVAGCATGFVLVVAWFFGKWLIGGGA